MDLCNIILLFGLTINLRIENSKKIAFNAKIWIEEKTEFWDKNKSLITYNKI